MSLNEVPNPSNPPQFDRQQLKNLSTFAAKISPAANLVDISEAAGELGKILYACDFLTLDESTARRLEAESAALLPQIKAWANYIYTLPPAPEMHTPQVEKIVHALLHCGGNVNRLHTALTDPEVMGETRTSSYFLKSLKGTFTDELQILHEAAPFFAALLHRKSANEVPALFPVHKFPYACDLPGIACWSEGIILLIAKPGGGKDTQGLALANRLAIPFFSWSALVKDVAKESTTRGAQAREYLATNALASVAFAAPLLDERLSRRSNRNGCVIVGMPRTADQAFCLERIAEDRGLPIAKAVYLSVENDTAATRILSRDQGRSSDTPTGIAQRLAQFHDETEPVLKFYRQRGLLLEVDGSGSKVATADAIFSKLRLDYLLGLGNPS